MEEQEQTQPVQGTEEVASQTEASEPQPTVEELRKEIARKEAVIVETKRELSQERKRGASQQEIQTLQSEIRGMQDWMAGALDDVVARSSGDYEEPVKPSRKTYKESLEEKRKATPETKPEVPSDVAEFMDYIEDLGFTINHKLVKEAVANDRTPKEALDYLKEKMDTTSVDKDKDIAEKIRLGIEEEMKNRGLTTAGAGMPSASSGRTYKASDFTTMPMKEFKEKEEEIMEALRQGKIIPNK